MEKLSVVIPFLNEGEEVVKTLESLFSTVEKDFVEVIVINDGSQESHEEEIKSFGVAYLKNKIRRGVAFSRDFGVQSATCKTACLFDAHMRFKDDHWAENLVNEVEKDPESLFCTTCVTLFPDSTGIHDSNSRAYGAGIDLITGKEGKALEILEPTWIYLKKAEISYGIPCVLGANYFFNVEKYKKLLGLSGLEYWGCDEVYLSLKYWLSGGSCKIFPNVEIGHIFRDKPSPFTTSLEYQYFNKIFVAFVLLPQETSLKLLERLSPCKESEAGLSLFRRKLHQIIEYKKYYDGLFKRTFPQVMELLGITNS